MGREAEKEEEGEKDKKDYRRILKKKENTKLEWEGKQRKKRRGER